MISKNIKNVSIENANIFGRNFSGKETTYNRLGNRVFCVYIDDPDVAEAMKADGWNVKMREFRNTDLEPRPYVQVAVRFDGPFPPKVVLVTSRRKTILDEETVNELDYAEIQNVDLTIRPRVWEANGKDGVKAYLKTMYITIVEDEFADKYADDANDEMPF